MVSVDPAVTEPRSPPRRAHRLPRRRPHRLRNRGRAERLSSDRNTLVFNSERHRSSSTPTPWSPPRAHLAPLQARNPETAVGTLVIDYIDDDPSLPEQPDDGVQEPDATIDDESYYSRGAYYYVQAADNDQE
ncbi:uncharacterized protein [Triticum aestivum]|uniref:uncharacterized protein n=1 Tax=Triticum aestivum TaxID=4565 RepID=UPI001D0056C3|nr:uncharacterized protein LOC123185013 [Triticum aestivum]